MAFKKSLAQRLFNITKITNCRISSSSVGGTVSSSTRASEANIAPDPGDNGVFRRFLHKRTGFQPQLRSTQIAGNNLAEKLREMDIGRNRIRLDGLTPPAEIINDGVSVEDARKLLKVAQLEMVKSRLRDSPKSCVTVSEFIRICSEYCSDQDQAVKIAKMLDDSAAVIILGDIVFLRPEQVAKAIQGFLPGVGGSKVPESMRKEFEEMERIKLAIDNKADIKVRRELKLGMSLLMAQTMLFVRLTFWELTWDVMEPICFFLTSSYFMAGSVFFLRTKREPTFEGFYQARFDTKQKHLMKLHNFDIEKYNKLKAACSPSTSPTPNFDLGFQNSSTPQHH